MKVPLVKKHCLLRRGGSQRYCFNLARVLMIARGREVTVISRSMDAELRDELAFVSPRFLRGPFWLATEPDDGGVVWSGCVRTAF